MRVCLSVSLSLSHACALTFSSFPQYIFLSVWWVLVMWVWQLKKVNHVDVKSSRKLLQNTFTKVETTFLFSEHALTHGCVYTVYYKPSSMGMTKILSVCLVYVALCTFPPIVLLKQYYSHCVRHLIQLAS